MNNGKESIQSQSKTLGDQSSIYFSPSISNKSTHYYNSYSNSINNNNDTYSSVIRYIKIQNYSSPKNNIKMKFKSRLITKHYNIVSNVQSINDRKLLSNSLPKNPIITEPSCNLEKFLPPKTSQKQKTLVIDLDETLVHSYFDTIPPRKAEITFQIPLDNKKVQVYTLVRPGAIDFLEKMSEIFEIVIFTASMSIYALPIINFIDKKKKCDFKLFREHCCSFNNGFIKDLKRLSRDLNNIILLDNNPNCYFLNKENAIPIKTWIDDVSDRELFKIIPYLKFLANENIEDIRPIITKIKRGNRINYYRFNKIIEKFKKSHIIDNKEKIIIEEETKKENVKNVNIINLKNNYKSIKKEEIELIIIDLIK